MKRTAKPGDVSCQRRKDRLLREWVHDPYQSKRKLPEPTVCPDCNAVYHDGRWQWAENPSEAHEVKCPACRRIHDGVPVGFLSLGGEFFLKHKDEILNLVHNSEAKEKSEHPLERIMDIEEQEDGLLITFTGAHVTRGVGEALHHAYKGELDFHYSDEDKIIRVSWRRE
jgi:NMD protein affecting ribosome stability and mRNA decay